MKFIIVGIEVQHFSWLARILVRHDYDFTVLQFYNLISAPKLLEMAAWRRMEKDQTTIRQRQKLAGRAKNKNLLV